MTDNSQNLIKEQMLAQMGIKPLWILRETADAQTAQQTDVVVAANTENITEEVAQKMALPDAADFENASVVPEPPAVAAEIPLTPSSKSLPPTVNAKELDWDALIQSINHCKACGLCEKRKRAVPGVGDRNADWMLIGEGPGAEEDEQGEPFVGQAGKLLDSMLASMGLKRGNNVYIANAVKCRPPGNRTPEASEMAICRPYLERQIELVNPKLIIALGRPAVQTLLGGEPKISSSRGRVFHYEPDSNSATKIPVVVTYHPAYLLRNLVDKSKAWEDLCFAQDQMAKISIVHPKSN